MFKLRIRQLCSLKVGTTYATNGLEIKLHFKDHKDVAFALDIGHKSSHFYEELKSMKYRAFFCELVNVDKLIRIIYFNTRFPK